MEIPAWPLLQVRISQYCSRYEVNRRSETIYYYVYPYIYIVRILLGSLPGMIIHFECLLYLLMDISKISFRIRKWLALLKVSKASS